MACRTRSRSFGFLWAGGSADREGSGVAVGGGIGRPEDGVSPRETWAAPTTAGNSDTVCPLSGKGRRHVFGRTRGECPAFTVLYLPLRFSPRPRGRARQFR